MSKDLIPFEPKLDECYWTYVFSEFKVIKLIWSGGAMALCRKACGIVFRTEEEAIEARPAKYKELTGKEWESR